MGPIFNPRQIVERKCTDNLTEWGDSGTFMLNNSRFLNCSTENGLCVFLGPKAIVKEVEFYNITCAFAGNYICPTLNLKCETVNIESMSCTLCSSSSRISWIFQDTIDLSFIKGAVINSKGKQSGFLCSNTKNSMVSKVNFSNVEATDRVFGIPAFDFRDSSGSHTIKHCYIFNCSCDSNSINGLENKKQETPSFELAFMMGKNNTCSSVYYLRISNSNGKCNFTFKVVNEESPTTASNAIDLPDCDYVELELDGCNLLVKGTVIAKVCTVKIIPLPTRDLEEITKVRIGLFIKVYQVVMAVE